jgi:DNA replication protein DnaC
MNAICSYCNGTGFILKEGAGDSVVSVRCECALRERGSQLLRAARIPRRYAHCNLDNFEPLEAGLQAARQTARDWVERWPDRSELGLMFLGPPGTGKTHLVVGISRELAERKGTKVLFYEQRDLLKSLQGTFDGQSGKSEADVLDPVLEAEVLVLDDLGAGRTTPWARDVLHDIIAHRYNAKLPLIITSNRATGDDDDDGKDAGMTLRDRLGDALMSRIYEMCLIVPMEARDFRRDILHARHRF